MAQRYSDHSTPLAENKNPGIGFGVSLSIYSVKLKASPYPTTPVALRQSLSTPSRAKHDLLSVE